MKVHCSDEDQDALNADMTQLTLEDFSTNCGICSLKFLTKNSVAHHQKIEHRVGVEKMIECEKCQKVLKPANLKAHMKTHMEKHLLCKLCYMKFRKNNHLNEHQTKVHKKESQYLNREILDSDLSFPCVDCDLSFITQNVLNFHTRKAHQLRTNEKSLATRKPKACRLCYKTFSKMKAVISHEKVAHVKETEYLQREILLSELVHACTLCEKMFVTKNLLVSHKKKHEVEKYESLRSAAYDNSTKRHSCKLCYRTFDRFHNVVAHFELVHRSDLERINEQITGEDLIFSCDGCDLTFISNDILTYHKDRGHAEINAKTQQCSHCIEVFKYHSTLRKHSFSKHNIKLEKEVNTINCKLCDKSIKGKGNLKSHTTNIHTSAEEVNALTLDKINEEDLKFLCEHCDKKFLTEDVRRYHKTFCQRGPKGGSRGQSQKCENCPELFPSYNSLMKHSFKAHNIKSRILNCKLCDKPVKGKWNLRTHEKNLHAAAEEIEALKMDKINEQLLSVQCLNCGKRFLNEGTLRCHNSFCKNAASRTAKYSAIYEGRKDCMLCLVSFGTTLESANHFHGMHRKFGDEISALKSLHIGQKISLQSKCKFCEKRFLNRHVLKYHYKKIHSTEESKKNWDCEFCKKEFKPEKCRRSTVRAHMRDEHDLPEYNCLEGKVANATNKTAGAGNQAKQNFQLMLAKMLGMKN